MQSPPVTPVKRPPITPRSPSFDFSSVPRRWFGGLALPTHTSNGVNLLFPMGERFFVRSVRHFEKVIADDPELLAAVKAFYKQEGHHAGAHERFFQALSAQGFSVDRYLKIYRLLAFDGLERVTGPELHLAVTAALEHYTALMAEGALRYRFIDAAPPAVRDLMLWHAAEEIEHKSVAFDVLRRVNPSYGLRMAGLALATAALAGFWAAATAMFLAQDDALHLETLRELRRAQEAHGGPRRYILRDVFWEGIRAYARPDFHPTQLDNDDLARDFLAAFA